MRSTEVVDVIVAVLKMRDTQAGVCTEGNDPVEKKEVMMQKKQEDNCRIKVLEEGGERLQGIN